MCHSHRPRGCCGGRRRAHQPFLVTAAIAGGTYLYSQYNERKSAKGLLTTSTPAYPNTLDAPGGRYPEHPGAVTQASNIAASTPPGAWPAQDDKTPASFRDMHETTPPPPAYEEVAQRRLSTESDVYDSRRAYPDEPRAARDGVSAKYETAGQAQAVPNTNNTLGPIPTALPTRPRLTRAPSSSSSASSLSGLQHEYDKHHVPLPAGLTSKAAVKAWKREVKANKKNLKWELMRARGMQDAEQAVLRSLAGLVGMGVLGERGEGLTNGAAADLSGFAVTKVDGGDAVLLRLWARKAAKSKVRVDELRGRSMGEAAGVIAGRSRKVRFWRW